MHRLELFWRCTAKQGRRESKSADALRVLVTERMSLHGAMRAKVQVLEKPSGGKALYTIASFVKVADAVDAYESLSAWELDAESLGFQFDGVVYSKQTATLWVAHVPFAGTRSDGAPIVKDFILQRFAEFGRFSFYASTEGSVFIKYDRAEHAERALAAMHGFRVGRHLELIVDYTLSDFGNAKRMTQYLPSFRRDYRDSGATPADAARFATRRRNVSRSPPAIRRTFLHSPSASSRRVSRSPRPLSRRNVSRSPLSRSRRVSRSPPSRSRYVVSPQRQPQPQSRRRDVDVDVDVDVASPNVFSERQSLVAAQETEQAKVAAPVAKSAVLPSFTPSRDFIPLETKVARVDEPSTIIASAVAFAPTTTIFANEAYASHWHEKEKEQTGKRALETVEDVCAWFRAQSIQEDRKKKIIAAVLDGCVDGAAFRLMTSPQSIVDMVKSANSSSLYSPDQPTSEEFKLPFGECLKLASAWNTRCFS